ncbi:MAG: hypothetical protein ABSH03_09050 [Candidatus Lustribacter sp.]|jgi:hypothetical protein
MSRVAERALVAAPLPSAARFLDAFIAANSAPGGTGARVVLHVGGFSEPAIVTLTPAHQKGDMTPRFEVHWQSESGSAAFPIFDGQLTVQADQDYDTFALAIDGTYEPPGGLAGKVFDMVVGERLAAETTKNLLATIRDYVQAFFQTEEQHKKK